LQSVVDAHTPPKRDEAPRERALVLCLVICTDALATAEDDLPVPIRRLRSALERYAVRCEKNEKLRGELFDALMSALPLLDAEAKARAEEIAKAKRRSTKARLAHAWSPRAIRVAPRRLAKSLELHTTSVFDVRRLLRDLTRPNAHALVKVGEEVSPKIQMTKLLANAKFTVAEIATVTEPYGNAGTARRHERNVVTQRTKSKTIVSRGFTIPDDPALQRRLEKDSAALLRATVPNNQKRQRARKSRGA
jgi:hypothetical protein